MIVETGKTLYRCERCRKHYHVRAACERHERICQCKNCSSFVRTKDAGAEEPPHNWDGYENPWPGGCRDGFWTMFTYDDPEFPCPHRDEMPEPEELYDPDWA